jgi:hypothetical protein
VSTGMIVLLVVIVVLVCCSDRTVFLWEENREKAGRTAGTDGCSRTDSEYVGH